MNALLPDVPDVQADKLCQRRILGPGSVRCVYVGY